MLVWELPGSGAWVPLLWLTPNGHLLPWPQFPASAAGLLIFTESLLGSEHPQHVLRPQLAGQCFAHRPPTGLGPPHTPATHIHTLTPPLQPGFLTQPGTGAAAVPTAGGWQPTWVGAPQTCHFSQRTRPRAASRALHEGHPGGQGARKTPSDASVLAPTHTTVWAVGPDSPGSP